MCDIQQKRGSEMWLMKAECYGKIDVYRNEYD